MCNLLSWVERKSEFLVRLGGRRKKKKTSLSAFLVLFRELIVRTSD